MNTGSSGLTRHTQYTLPSERVPSHTLESALDLHGLQKVDALKIDVEGHEHDVLIGSKSVFEKRRIKHLLVEFHPTILAQRNLNVESLTSFLKSCGYSHRDGTEFHWFCE